MAFVTSGSGNIVNFLLNQKRSNALVRDDILKFCGIDARVFQVDNARTLNDSQRQKIRKAVSSGLDWLK